MLFLQIVVYGMHVMRGVIEEKANRIVEVVISVVHANATHDRENHWHRTGRLDAVCFAGRIGVADLLRRRPLAGDLGFAQSNIGCVGQLGF